MNWRLTLACFLVVAIVSPLQAMTVHPVATDGPLVNPGMGFVFYHYSNRLWAYGSQLEPGDTLDWFPGVSTVYFRVNWGQLEPEEGKFRWDIIDSIAQSWIAKGKKIAIRVMCCENRFRWSTPKWVRDAGAKGIDYTCKPDPDWPETDAVLWEPNYTDSVFLEKLEHFAKAFAARYDGDSSVAFVDIGSFGMWGEGHTGFSSKLSNEETERIVKIHMDLWRRAMPRTYLVISDDVSGGWNPAPDAEEMRYARQLGIGFRDDSIMCCPPPHSWKHAAWAKRFSKQSPVVIETGHYNLLEDNLRANCERWSEDLFVASVIENRASYMSIHGWPHKFLERNRPAIERINRILGYRLELREATYPDSVKIGASFEITSVWSNVGVAPCHRGATLCWSLLNDRGLVVWSCVDAQSNARSLPAKADGEDKPIKFSSTCHFGYVEEIPVINDGVLVCAKKELPGAFDNLMVPTLKPGVYDLAVSFGTPQGTPEIALPQKEHVDKRYPIGKITII